MSKPCYRRLLLKLSGEHLRGKQEAGIDPDHVQDICAQVAEVREQGVQLAIMIGGGNILRGAEAAKLGVGRATADYMGMLGTMINGLAMQDGLERNGVPTRMMSSLRADEVCEPYIRRRAIRHLEQNRVVLLVGGIGIPFFTTDTAAAVLALETEAEVLMKATKVDGVYSADPHKEPDAERFDALDFDDVIRRNLRVMDQTAFAHCRENNLPILVFSLKTARSIIRAAHGESIGTWIGSKVDEHR